MSVSNFDRAKWTRDANLDSKVKLLLHTLIAYADAKTGKAHPSIGALASHLVDKRYGAMKPTVLIGNLVPDQLVGALGNSIVDRCNDGGVVIFCDWASLRGSV